MVIRRNLSTMSLFKSSLLISTLELFRLSSPEVIGCVWVFLYPVNNKTRLDEMSLKVKRKQEAARAPISTMASRKQVPYVGPSAFKKESQSVQSVETTEHVLTL